MMLSKVFKPILVICAILAFAGIVYSFQDHYERRIDRDGEGYIYWQDANTEKTCQASARVSKYGSIWPFVYVSEWANGASKDFTVTKPNVKTNGTYYLYVYRKGAISKGYRGADELSHDWSGKIWFTSPKKIKTKASAKVSERWDSDTDRVEVEF